MFYRSSALVLTFTRLRYADEGLFRLEGDDSQIGKMPHRKGFSVHYFCEKCSSNIYWHGLGKVGVNVRLLDEVDIAKLEPTFFDGKGLL